MILQKLGWSYGHLREMQIIQKAVQLTPSTFCVKTKTSLNVVSFKKCHDICNISCIYGRYINLILSELS